MNNQSFPGATAFAGANAPVSDLGSNLYVTRDRIQLFTRMIRQSNGRLQSKNIQLMGHAIYALRSNKEELRDAVIPLARALLDELNDALAELETELGALDNHISITENI